MRSRRRNGGSTRRRRPRRPAALVADTLYEPGEYVAAGAPVVSLLPPGNVKVRFYVPEAVVATVQPGAHRDGSLRRLRCADRRARRLRRAAGRVHAAGHLQPREPREARLPRRGAAGAAERAAEARPAGRSHAEVAPTTRHESAVIDVRGPDQVVRRPQGRRRRLDPRAEGPDPRLPRAERQRQDDDDPHAVRTAHAGCRRGHVPRLRPDPRGREDQARSRLHDAEVQLLRGPVDRGEPRLRRARVRRAGPAGRRRSHARAPGARRTAASSSPARSRAAGSSGSRWPRACCIRRSCCCSTSPPPASIRARGAISGRRSTRSPPKA